MTGPELDRLTDEALARQAFDTPVFARVAPEHKVRLVKAFQRRGMVVAMTGDAASTTPRP